ncbi:MAG TPA: MOSC domain-containing protein [Gaiellaceae bacterium]|nr:MOSC domain-containing protein [Gaiellaceae bacterium]
MATVAGLFTSPGRKSGVSTAHDRVRAVAGHGFEGCAHANPPKREVLFVSQDHLDELELQAGVIRENVTVAGDDVEQWPIGQRVRAGEAVFEITMVCDPCERMEALRPGLRERLEGKRGMLARVVEGGDVAVGDELSLL